MTVLVCRVTFGLVFEGLNDGKAKIKNKNKNNIPDMRHYVHDLKLKLRV